MHNKKLKEATFELNTLSDGLSDHLLKIGSTSFNKLQTANENLEKQFI
jgi:hypothetical protein